MLQGLAAGADDFLTKPFNPEILLARARAILRRSQRSNRSNSENHGSNGFHAHNGQNGFTGSNDQNGHGRTAAFTYNDGYLSIDIERHEVLVHGKRVKLTPIEFRLLVYLARNAGKLLTFDKILANVWGNEYQGSMDYVHVHISHLRRKIEDGTEDSRYIMTVYREGYIFEKQELVYKP